AYSQRNSPIGSALTSTAFRRVVRPNARMMRALPFTSAAAATNILARVNAGEVSAAPPKTVPAGVATVDQVGGVVASGAGIPVWLAHLLADFAALPLFMLVAFVVIAILFGMFLPGLGWWLAVLVIAGGIYLFGLLRKWTPLANVIAILDPARQAPALVDA